MAKNKTAIGAVALALAGVLGIGYVATSVALNSWNPAGWTNRTPTQITRPADNVSDIDGKVVINGTENNGIELTSLSIAPEDFENYSISAQAESANIVTAHFIPENATHNGVIWTVTGGDDKVTIESSSTNSLEAAVTVLGAFSTQAVITCTSNDNADLTATLTVDYVKVAVYYKGSAFKYINTLTDTTPPQNYVNFSSGSLMPTSLKGDFVIGFTSEDLYNYLLTKWDKLVIKKDYSNIDLYFSERTFSINDLLSEYSDSDKEKICQDIAIYFGGKSNSSAFYIKYQNVHTYYNDIDVYDIDILYSHEIRVKSFDNYSIPAKGVGLDKDSMIFGPNGAIK